MGSRAVMVSCLLVLAMSVLVSSRALVGGDSAALGGWRNSRRGNANSAEVEELARFAVQEHNKKENTLLELVRVVKAKEQVVAGIMHQFTLEVIEAGQKKLYEAKVWVKPWLHFKQLQEFKHVTSPSSFTSSSYLGNRRGNARLA